MDDKFLRSVAALQANLKMLDSQSDALSDFGDMQALRKLRAELSDYIEGHVAMGELPPDPFRVIEERLMVVSSFFAVAEQESQRLLNWRKDWLGSIPEVALAALETAQTKLSEFLTGLPELQNSLRQMLSPGDWDTTPAIVDLHPELLITAECAQAVSLPKDREARSEFYAFAHGDGNLMRRVEDHLWAMAARIEELLALRAEHLEMIATAESHLAAHNFRSAAAILDALGLSGNASTTQSKKKKQPKVNQQFADVPYETVVSGTAKLFERLAKFTSLDNTLASKFNNNKTKHLKDEFSLLRNSIAMPDSELGRECFALLASMEAKLAAFLATRKASRIKSTMVIMALVTIVAAAIAYLTITASTKAEEDRKSRSEAAAKDAHERAEELIRIEREKAEEEARLKREQEEAATSLRHAQEEEAAKKEREKAERIAKIEELRTRIPDLDLEQLRLLADNGDPYAQALLARTYMLGATNTSIDMEQAALWAKKSADQNHPLGLYSMGVMAEDPEFLQKSPAKTWYEKAGNAGLKDVPGTRDRQWMQILGSAYFYGRGINKDQKNALEWYRKAAEAGDVYGMTCLGYCYHDGTGAAKDEAEAIKWFRKAAVLGETKSMTCLGACYYNGHGVTKDEMEAVKWLRKAAELGEVEAMTRLGSCYYDGLGVTKDEVEAVKWLSKAVKLGNATAMFKLGLYYSNCTGMRKDVVEAIKWFRKAAELGNTKAMIELGLYYSNGTGMPKDEVEAVKWFRKAANFGDPAAETYIKNLKEFKHRDVLKNASEGGDSQAMKSAEGKPRDRYLMPVYAFSDRERLVRTVSYTIKTSNNGLSDEMNASGSKYRYDDKVRSAAADWSFYPVGTTFRIKGLPYLYEIDDYQFNLVGTGSVAIFKPNEEVRTQWGTRNVNLSVTQWGSFTKAAKILESRTENENCKKMLKNIIRQRPDLSEHDE